MGSLGWEQCYWCWKWVDGMYIPNPIEEPLCAECLWNWVRGQRPPWQPDSRERLRKFLARIFPENVALRISEMAREAWEP